jgi:hypothetical protein
MRLGVEFGQGFLSGMKKLIGGCRARVWLVE